VVVLWIHGTPTVGNAIVDPFVPRGQAVVEYVGTYDFAALGVREPREIVARLRATLAQASGWPVRDGCGSGRAGGSMDRFSNATVNPVYAVGHDITGKRPTRRAARRGRCRPPLRRR